MSSKAPARSISLILQHLELPAGAPVSLRVQPCGTASEIYKFHHDTLTPHALAASRLAIPISTVSTHRAADKLKAQNDAHDRERKDRADRLNGIKKAIPPSLDHIGTTMNRTMSSPAVPAPSSGSNTPMVPLKTRVVQLLALGPLSVDEIVSKVGMSEGEVVRVVKGVSRLVHGARHADDPGREGDARRLRTASGKVLWCQDRDMELYVCREATGDQARQAGL